MVNYSVSSHAIICLPFGFIRLPPSFSDYFYFSQNIYYKYKEGTKK